MEKHGHEEYKFTETRVIAREVFTVHKYHFIKRNMYR
jgi:hypothetical protein